MWFRALFGSRKRSPYLKYNPEHGFARPDNLIWTYVSQVTEVHGDWYFNIGPGPQDIPVTKAILALPPEEQVALLPDAFWAVSNKRIVDLSDYYTKCARRIFLWRLIALITRRKLPFTDQSLQKIFSILGRAKSDHAARLGGLWKGLERYAAAHELSDPLREILRQFRNGCFPGTYRDRLDVVLGENLPPPRAPGPMPNLVDTAWGSTIRTWIASLEPQIRAVWIELFELAFAGHKVSRPGKRWRARAEELVSAIGPAKFAGHLVWMMRRFDTQSYWNSSSDSYGVVPYQGVDPNQETLKGLIWAVQFCGAKAPTEDLRQFSIRCYQKRGSSWDAERLGNAVFVAFESMPDDVGLPYLFLSHGDILHEGARSFIRRAIERAAKSRGVTVEELGDYGIPAFGMDRSGILREEFSNCTVEISIDASGRIRSSILDRTKEKPKQISLRRLGKGDWFLADRYRRLIERMEAERERQCRRLEELYFSRRVRTVEEMRMHYVEHPFVAHFIPRIIWLLRKSGSSEAALFDAGKFYDVGGAEIPWVDQTTAMSPWHPAFADVDEVRAWRNRIDTLGIKQPFEQANREIFIPTDVEFETELYSNRFAGHFVWEFSLYERLEELGWESSESSDLDENIFKVRRLANFDLQAALFCDPVAEAGRGGKIDTALKSTGHIMFARVSDADMSPIRIADIPQIVFSEVMHDLSDAVGGSAIAVNMDWCDHTERDRPETFHFRRSTRHNNLDARKRAAKLQEILPALVISNQCRVSGCDLMVQGKINAYRIHLGSAAVFMQPNDQHLCIVEGRHRGRYASQVPNSTEIDTTLSSAISKAILLANDHEVTDETIKSQIVGS